MFKKLDHIVFVVKDIDKAIKFYSDIFHTAPWERGVVEIPESGFKMTMLPVGGSLLELARQPILKIAMPDI